MLLFSHPRALSSPSLHPSERRALPPSVAASGAETPVRENPKRGAALSRNSSTHVPRSSHRLSILPHNPSSRSRGISFSLFVSFFSHFHRFRKPSNTFIRSISGSPRAPVAAGSFFSPRLIPSSRHSVVRFMFPFFAHPHRSFRFLSFSRATPGLHGSLWLSSSTSYFGYSHRSNDRRASVDRRRAANSGSLSRPRARDSSRETLDLTYVEDWKHR